MAVMVMVAAGGNLSSYQQLMFSALLHGGCGVGLLSPPSIQQAPADSAATAAALGLNLARVGKGEGAAVDEPLDLSKKAGSSGEPEPELPPFHPASASGVQDFLSSNGVAVLKSATASSQANKRNYSQADLEKAVHDIRFDSIGSTSRIHHHSFDFFEEQATGNPACLRSLRDSTVHTSEQNLQIRGCRGKRGLDSDISSLGIHDTRTQLQGTGRKRGRTAVAISSSPLDKSVHMSFQQGVVILNL